MSTLPDRMHWHFQKPRYAPFLLPSRFYECCGRLLTVMMLCTTTYQQGPLRTTRAYEDDLPEGRYYFRLQSHKNSEACQNLLPLGVCHRSPIKPNYVAGSAVCCHKPGLSWTGSRTWSCGPGDDDDDNDDSRHGRYSSNWSNNVFWMTRKYKTSRSGIGNRAHPRSYSNEHKMPFLTNDIPKHTVSQ